MIEWSVGHDLVIEEKSNKRNDYRVPILPPFSGQRGADRGARRLSTGAGADFQTQLGAKQ